MKQAVRDGELVLEMKMTKESAPSAKDKISNLEQREDSIFEWE